MRHPRADEEGMILVNVLMFVAIAAGLVLLMINREELALDRGLRNREAARALAVVRGGELSALVALRRDAEKAAGEDYPTEAWSQVAANAAPIEGGSFDLAIADAEGRFNVNTLRAGVAAPTLLFQEIARSAGLDDDQIVKAIEAIRLYGPLTDLRPLRMAGVDRKQAAALEPLLTALPGDTKINLNAASVEMLAILFRDGTIAQRLAKIREREGKLTPADLAAEKVMLPWGTSFTSNTFWIRTRATIGSTTQQSATLIKRGRGADRKAFAWPVERWRGAAVPPDAPGFKAQ